jgi:Kef-type K+ transport system membrane component KefB
MWLLVADLALILAAAAVARRAVARIGQPSVIGDVIAGFMLGPTVLADVSGELFPAAARDDLRALGDVGLVAFAFAAGLAVDRPRMPSSRWIAVIASSAFAVPFTTGLAVGVLLHGWAHPAVPPLPFSLFVAAAMSITAFPVLVRILQERGLAGTPLGSLATTTAAANDALAWGAVAFALAVFNSSDSFAVAGARAAAAVPLAAVVTCAVPFVFARLSRGGGRWSGPVIALGGLIGSVAATDAVGVHGVLGAFVFGLAARHGAGSAAALRLARPARVTAAVLLPVMLALPGLGIDATALAPADAGVTALVVGVAALTKMVGAALPARFAGLPWREASALGILLNTRGLMELVVLNLGLTTGLLDERLYVVLLVMALITTLMTAPLLALVRHDPTDDDRSVAVTFEEQPARAACAR